MRPYYSVQVVRKQIVVAGFTLPNKVVKEGRRQLLLRGLTVDANTAGNTVALVGLIANSGFTGLSDDDTGGSHAGWSELTGVYAGNRMRGTGLAHRTTVYTITANGVMRGVFLTWSHSPGAIAALYSTAVNGEGIPLLAGDNLGISYVSTYSQTL